MESKGRMDRGTSFRVRGVFSDEICSEATLGSPGLRESVSLLN